MIKLIHISAVLLSGSFFLIRGIGALKGAAFMQMKLVKIAPHVIDTVLLVSAIVLCVQLQQYPIIDHWITVKVVSLMAYIVVGTIAIKRAKNTQQRFIAFAAAIAIFLFMLSVAKTHNPLGFLALL